MVLYSRGILVLLPFVPLFPSFLVFKQRHLLSHNDSIGFAQIFIVVNGQIFNK